MGKKEVADDGEGDETMDLRAVFVDTNLDTRMALLVSNADTVYDLKQKLALEHSKCFPNYGDIEVNALKVKRRAGYYHLCDSMLLRTVFSGVAKTWFLSADVSSWSSNCHNSHGTPKRLPTPPRINLSSPQVLHYPRLANQTVHADGSPNMRIVVNCKNDANFRSLSSETGKKSGQCQQKVPVSPGEMHKVWALADENKKNKFKTPMSEGSFVYSDNESLASRNLGKGKRPRKKRVAVDEPAAAGDNVGGRDVENQQATGIAPMGADNNAVPDANEETAQKAAEVGSNHSNEHKSKTDSVLKQPINPINGRSKISETHAGLRYRASNVDCDKQSEGIQRTEQDIQKDNTGKKKRRVLKNQVLLDDNASVDAKSKAQPVEVLNKNYLADVVDNRYLNDDIGQLNYSSSTAGIDHEIEKTENMLEQANFDNKAEGDPLTEIKSLLCGSDIRHSAEFINNEINREPIGPEGVTDTSHGDDGTTSVRVVAESDAKNSKKRKKTGVDSISKTRPLPFTDGSAHLKEDVFHPEPSNTDLENEAFENNAKLLISKPSVSVIKEMQNDITQTKLPLPNTNVDYKSSSTPEKRGKRANDSSAVHQSEPSITTSGIEAFDNRAMVVESSENKSKKVTTQQMSIGKHHSVISVKKRDNARGASRSKSAKPSLKSLPKGINLEPVENGKIECDPSNPGPFNEAVDPGLVSALATEETEKNNNKPKDMSLKLVSEGESNQGHIQKQAVSEDPQPNVVFAESDMQSSKAGIDNEFVDTDLGNIINGQGVANISQQGEMQTLKLAKVPKFGEPAEIKRAKLSKKTKKQHESKVTAKNLSDFPLGEQEQTLKLAKVPKFGENAEIMSAKLGKKTKKQQESKATAKNSSDFPLGEQDRSAKVDRGEPKMGPTYQSPDLKKGGLNGAEFKSSTPDSALASELDMKSFEKKAEEKSLRNHSTIVDHQKETRTVCQSDSETPQPTPVHTTDEDIKGESEMPKKKTKRLRSSNMKNNPPESSLKKQDTKAKSDELEPKTSVAKKESRDSTPVLASESDMKSPETKADDKSLRNHSFNVDNIGQNDSETPQPTPVHRTDEDMKGENEMPKKKSKKLPSSNIKKNPPESSLKEQDSKAYPDELDHERSVAKKKPRDSTSALASESDMESPETKADDKSVRNHSFNVDKIYQSDLETLQPSPAHRSTEDRKDESEKPKKKTKKLHSSMIKKNTPESSRKEQGTKAKPDEMEHELSVAKNKLRDSTSALASESNMNSSETKADGKSLRNHSINAELLKNTENIFQSDLESLQPTPVHRIGEDRKDESEKPKKKATELRSSNMKKNPPPSSLKERNSKAKLAELEHESSVAKKKHGDSALQSGLEASKSSVETVVPKFQADPVKSKTVPKKRTALEFSGISGANAGVNSISGTLSDKSNNINQAAHQVRNTAKLSLLNQLAVGNGKSSSKTAKTVRKSPQQKSLVTSSVSIFNKESSSSSEGYDEEENEGSDSDCSTRTPSEPSSSDYSEGESKDVTNDHGESKALNSQDPTRFMELLFKSSSNFKKAKVVASQTQLEYSEPVEFVPDSQGIL